MDKRRAQEIASSPVMANVTYQGNNVYIENVDGSSNIANIHQLGNPKQREQVSLSQLQEN